MAGAYKPGGGGKFWLNGRPLEDIPFTVEAGAQVFWIDGRSDGLLWTGLTPYSETATLFPAGPARNVGTGRYWLNGLPFDMAQKGIDRVEGSQAFWLHGATTTGLWPAITSASTFPALFLAP